jgi:putative heme-binding domain-containing protein
MRWTRAVPIVVSLFGLGTSLVAAQGPPQKNPLDGDVGAIKAGMGIFRSRCADCHGVDARGIRGPDITHVWAEGRTDNGLFRTLRTGVPNTEMPALDAVRTRDVELWQILAYLRTLAAPAPSDPPRGNAQNGERVFRANCASCHQVNGKGGHLGPDLSRIGGARARDAIVNRIIGAAEGSRPGYEPVTLTPADGQPIHGVKKNEDLFSVQIMDTRERIQGYEKDKMQAVVDDKKSAMPVFGPDRLSQSDLDDVVRYLQGLRGFDPAVRQ